MNQKRSRRCDQKHLLRSIELVKRIHPPDREAKQPDQEEQGTNHQARTTRPENQAEAESHGAGRRLILLAAAPLHFAGYSR